jgi:heme/copper-type cytochrome/quinol oxidase subunit 4
MSSDGLRRTVVALALSLIVGVLASAALANSDVRRTLSPTLVLVVASFLTVLPLVAQATFLLLQSRKQGRRAVALPSLGVDDG